MAFYLQRFKGRRPAFPPRPRKAGTTSCRQRRLPAMRNRIHIAILGAGLLIPLASFAQGALRPEAQHEKSYPSDRSSTTTYTGTVVEANEKAGKLIVKSWDNSQKQFAVDSNTAFTLHGTNDSLSTLKPGEEVIVTAEKDKAVSIALSTTDHSGSSQTSQNESQPSASMEAMRNKGVNPYGTPSATTQAQAAIRQQEGLRT